MTPILRILAIEDSETDYQLTTRNLSQHGVEAELHRVDTYQALAEALETRDWDAVLSDYNLPGMDFRTALGVIRDQFPELPVILVSGSIGEEEALDLLRVGLSDFVLKDRPIRLAGALTRALEDAHLKKQRRTIEAALKESEARFATIFRASPLGIGLSQLADGRLVEVNDALAKMHGLRREEMIGRTTLELGIFLHPEDREHLHSLVKQDGRVENFRYKGRRKNGELRDLLISAERTPLGGQDYLLGMISDITPLLKAEQALQLSEHRYRDLFEHMSVAIAHCRLVMEEGRPLDWEYLAVNDGYKEVTGLPDVVGRRVSEVLPGLQLESPELIQAVREVVRTGAPSQLEVRITALDRWLSISLYCPAPGEFVAVLDNITGRKVAEETLRNSQARYQSIFQASPVGIVLSRLRDGVIIEANPAFSRLIGVPVEDVLGHTSVELGFWVNPSDRKRAILELRRKGWVKSIDTELLAKSGTVVPVNWSTESVELDGERVMVNLVKDLTERREAEEERRLLEAEVAHGQKLDSLGALASGISHDMNNVLAAILTMVTVVEETHKEDPSISKSMRIVLQAANRGKDLVKALTGFARKDISDPKPLELNELVQHEAELLNRTTLQKVQVLLSLQEELPLVMGDASAVSNLLMNLCVNALDAMPTGGQIYLSTRCGPSGEVELSVKDTGHGMSPDVRRRAMEPFFTTKPPGKGTGLGLALAFGTMKAHGGRIEIRSDIGLGTEIVLGFPRFILDEGEEEASIDLAEDGIARRLKILLVDDDNLVREAMPRLLESMGHTVVAVEGGAEALQVLGRDDDPDLVILDLNMPGMDGDETLVRLRRLKPSLPVLLATGYHDALKSRILEQYPNVNILVKPFSVQELKVKLAQMV